MQALALDLAGRRRYTEHLRTRVFGQAPVHEDLRDVAASLDARAARWRSRQQQQQQQQPEQQQQQKQKEQQHQQGRQPAGDERQTDPRDSQLHQDQQLQQQVQTEAPHSAQFGTVSGNSSGAEGTGQHPTYYSAMRHPTSKSKPLAGHPSYLAVSERAAIDPVCPNCALLSGDIAPCLSFGGMILCGHSSIQV